MAGHEAKGGGFDERSGTTEAEDQRIRTPFAGMGSL